LNGAQERERQEFRADLGGSNSFGRRRRPFTLHHLRPPTPDFAKLLAKRTLTNLYNERPTWLDLAHRKLDEAVFASYGWNPAMSDEEILAGRQDGY
jgi:hypothetical protein